MKKCSKCSEVKPKTDFCKQTSSRDGCQSHCRKCNNNISKAWIKANPEVARKKCKKYAAKYPNKIRGSKLTIYWPNCSTLEALDNYNRLLLSQNNVCAICKKTEIGVDSRTGNIKNLAVDHCHKTNKIRGILCSKCNTIIGLLNENVDTCYAVAAYIEASTNV